MGQAKSSEKNTNNHKSKTFAITHTMFQKLKISVFKLLSEWQKIILKIKGVRIGKNCIVNKSPVIKQIRGSSIILGNSVTLTSNPRHNPLLTHPVELKTLTRDAIIEFKDFSGISGSTIICCTKITIGEHTIIGPDSLIYDAIGHDYSHETGWNSRRARIGRPITIGKKCYIGSKVIILNGTTIGDNCVIAAGSVINKNVPSGHKAAGNPAIITPLPKILGGP